MGLVRVGPNHETLNLSGRDMTVAVYSANESYNIGWHLQYNPYDRPGNSMTYDRPGNSMPQKAHTTCIASNATINEICCKEIQGSFLDIAKAYSNASDISTSNATLPYGMPNWCEVSGPNYQDHYNVDPASVIAFGECFNRTVNPSQNPGLYGEITVLSDVYQCQGVGNFSGVSVWGLPQRFRTVNGASLKTVAPVVGLLASVALSAVFGSFW